jgi:hypothetical protein
MNKHNITLAIVQLVLLGTTGRADSDTFVQIGQWAQQWDTVPRGGSWENPAIVFPTPFGSGQNLDGLYAARRSNVAKLLQNGQATVVQRMGQLDL